MPRTISGRPRRPGQSPRPIRGSEVGSTRRQSLAFFHQPNYDAEVIPFPSCVTADRPARYPRTTSGEHLYMKITKSRAINA